MKKTFPLTVSLSSGVLSLLFSLLLAPKALPTSAPKAIASIGGAGIIGRVTMVETSEGVVKVKAWVKGDPTVLTPGLHGLHLHEVGSCQTVSTPFSGAKGHFDPGPSGNSEPVEANHPYHSGDLLNLEVDEEGVGRLRTITTRVSLSPSPVSLLDDNGTAVIVHANPDLRKAGGTAAESGGSRLACGVLQEE
jgi:Cu-Zn family superoxide dismutase